MSENRTRVLKDVLALNHLAEAIMSYTGEMGKGSRERGAEFGSLSRSRQKKKHLALFT